MKASSRRARQSPAARPRPGRSRWRCSRATRGATRGSRKRSQRWTVSCPEQQIAEDPGGRAPDHVAVDLIDVGLEGHPPTDQAFERVAVDQVLERELEHLGDLGLLEGPFEPGLD